MSTPRMYVPANDRTYAPTDDPKWWKDVEPCGSDCHHPVHAFGHPERLRHLETASVIRSQGVPAQEA